MWRRLHNVATTSACWRPHQRGASGTSACTVRAPSGAAARVLKHQREQTYAQGGEYRARRVSTTGCRDTPRAVEIRTLLRPLRAVRERPGRSACALAVMLVTNGTDSTDTVPSVRYTEGRTNRVLLQHNTYQHTPYNPTNTTRTQTRTQTQHAHSNKHNTQTHALADRCICIAFADRWNTRTHTHTHTHTHTEVCHVETCATGSLRLCTAQNLVRKH